MHTFNKSFLAIFAASSLFATNAIADDHDTPKHKYWVGGSVLNFNADSDRPNDMNFYDEGLGLGLEAGIFINNKWSTRIDIMKTESELYDLAPFDSVKANHVAVDVLYALDDNGTYAFTGVRHSNPLYDMEEDYRSVGLGLGKYWEINDVVDFVTEVATHHDFGNDADDVTLKLGLVMKFGATTPTMQDSDSDGVMDTVDKCPSTLRGTSVDSIGCANDSDNDGVLNSLDKCPNTPKGDKVNASGCSMMTQKELVVDLQVLFANDSSVIGNPDEAKYAEFADFMKRYKDAEAVIEGHTSAVGNANYNMSLSEKRALAVKTLLIEQYGVDASRISAVGYGETRLKDIANTEVAHTANRRVEGLVTVKVQVKI
jgi:OOP family OmpA-OmpF porin